MSASVTVGTWVWAGEGAQIDYVVADSGQSVGFLFRADPDFELLLTEEVLARCAAIFPKALAELRATPTTGDYDD
ncbi:hypothetical protein F0L68_21525 [Solihabitans fulvus]|uniref:Uncharacterized protein n=1 Tax=Solihabitans fulvus TaxID=1892852 RepID=A0A5B2X8D4_9PSEU|nr:hypothetical protein [Solihabitans fulvus]KAA2259510.1 hypothetical protein F0L68_21525 [Solihabitans fulvus]